MVPALRKMALAVAKPVLIVMPGPAEGRVPGIHGAPREENKDVDARTKARA